MRLTLAPHVGGSIRELTWRGEHVLRPASAGATDDPFEMACFPMVPFANRIARGCFDFDGQTVCLAPNPRRLLSRAAATNGPGATAASSASSSHTARLPSSCRSGT